MEIVLVIIGVAIFIRVWLSQLGLHKQADKHHKEVVDKFDSLHDVRISCLQDVWQKWVDTKTEDEFDKWLHDKMHEV